jgi:membrane protease YdiL (CAAX protease family)
VSASKLSLASKIRQHPKRIRDVSLAVLSILVFASAIHQSFPIKLIALLGLGGTALVIAFSSGKQGALELFGLDRIRKQSLLYILPAAGMGILLGMLSRNSFDISLFPARITGVALVAPMVGAVEELIFRGYIQGHLRPIGRIFSIIYASAVHTSYKLLVILSLTIPLQFDFFYLVLWTFLGGLLFGSLKELSRSSLPPVIAHAVFDVVLYGGLAAFPAWVWA